MTEPTSHCFVARIGPAAPELVSRLAQWASASCQAHCVARSGDDISLYLQRQDAKTVRSMQSWLRKLTARWGFPLGDLGKGWLEMCTAEDVQIAARAGCGGSEAASAACAQADPAQEQSRRARAEREKLPRSAPPALEAPPCAEAAALLADGVLRELSPGFDCRAEEMYQQLAMRRGSAMAAY